MELSVEILIVGALIYFGWNKPFKEQVARANTTITSKLHGVGLKQTIVSSPDPALIQAYPVARRTWVHQLAFNEDRSTSLAT